MKEDILSTEEYLSQLDESNVILFFKEHIENLSLIPQHYSLTLFISA